MHQWRDIFDEQFLARLQRLHLIAKRLAARGTAGRRRSRRLGDGLEFADHRDYASGDDIRFIDWPYYARMEKLLLRLFHEHSEADVVVLLDVSASMGAGDGGRKFNYALRSAAALTYVAMASLERVICLPFAEDCLQPLRTGRNRGQIIQVLDFLAGLTPGGKTGLLRSVERFIRQYPAQGTVLVISDLADCAEELSQALLRLSQAKFDAAVLHIYGPQDARPALAGPMLLRDSEQGGQFTVHVGEQVLESYRLCWQRFVSQCERACLSRGCSYVAAPIDVPLEELVLRTLRAAGVIE